MKVKSIIAALLLMVAGMQTVWAQKVVLYKTNGQTIEYLVSELDSIKFLDTDAILVSKIELSETTITLNPNETKTLTATVLPENADNKEIAWESSDRSIATVDQQGNVTAVAAGSCTVTATATDGSGVKAQCTVKVIQLVTSITLSQTSITLKIGATQTLTATVLPENADNKEIIWESSNEGVATVDQQGNVTAVAAGSCTVTATATDGSGVKAQCTVKVIQLVTSITLSQTSITLKIGATQALTAAIQPDNATNKSVTWSSNDESVATVDQEGNVTAVAAGSCTITCAATDGSGVKAECTITVIQLVTSITLSQTSITLTTGTTHALTAAIQPDNATNKSVTWSSSDESVATVDQEGKVTAVAAGSCTITCAATDGSGVKAECTITVIQLVTSITLSQTTITLTTGTTQALTAAIQPDNATNKSVTWSSSDESIATVDQQGNVTAVAAGSCTITVTSTDGSGLKAECQVIVKENGGGTIVANPLDGYEWVDLGLPSGTLWAKCNIGASSPETYGNYYAWGETQSKYDEEEEECDYSWSTYKYGTENNITKYNAADGKTELEPEDDAATVNWSSNWQMPSATQFEELINSIYTTSTWTKQNGKKGFLITSNINRNSIFLPAAGFCYDSQEVYGGNNYGIYLSRTLTTYNELEADVLQFLSISGPNQISVSANYRYCGMSVRPVVIRTDVQPVTGITLSQTSITLSKQTGMSQTLTATIQPSNATNKYVIWSSDKKSVATVDQKGKVTAVGTGECTVTVQAADGSGVFAECHVTVVGGIEEHEYVDLGLPSGTLWASCNIGANSPEEYGNYYAWGETQPKESYSPRNYVFADLVEKYNSYNEYEQVMTVTKYCTDSSYGTVDGKAELDPEDDAATVNWGVDWQIPSTKQFAELIDESNTTVIWTTQNGVNGRLITSKRNYNSIFFPAAGAYGNYGIGTNNDDAGNRGSYYTRSVTGYVGIPVVDYFFFNPDENYAPYGITFYPRFTGHSIRPVVKRYE